MLGYLGLLLSGRGTRARVRVGSFWRDGVVLYIVSRMTLYNLLVCV